MNEPNRSPQETLRSRYLELTNQILPQLAQERKFPVRHNHCFQRIVLDNIFDCCWYDRLDRKKGAAYRQLDEAQLKQAIELAEAMITEPNEFIDRLNANSRRWRGKTSS